MRIPTRASVIVLTVVCIGCHGRTARHGSTATPTGRSSMASATVADAAATGSTPTTCGLGDDPSCDKPDDNVRTVTRSLRAGTRAHERYAVGSHAIDVTLVADSPRMMQHEPSLMAVEFGINDPQVEAQYHSEPLDSQFRQGGIVAAFRDANGTVLAQTADDSDHNGLSGWLPITAGFRQRLIAQSYVTSLAPGRYTFHVETTIRARIVGTEPWTDVPITLEAPIEVIPDDRAAMRRVLDALAVRAASQTDDARQALLQLRTVRDPAVIPALGRLAQIPDYEQRFAAYEALGHFDDPTAVSLLVVGAHTRGVDLDRARYTTDTLRDQSAEQLRVTAANGLARSMNAAALPALLSLRNDPSSLVRLVVLQRVAREHGSLASSLVHDLTTDPDDTVRTEAQRLMQARQGP